jgi:hypothetical protein
MRIVVDGMSLLLLSVLPVLLVVSITVQFLLIQQQLKQTDEHLASIRRTVRDVRHAPGTHAYCHQCQYFAQNRYVVCSLHPGGWPEQEERCTDWQVPEGRQNA